MNHPRVVLGLGSPNGDDQFGWAVIDGLRELGFEGITHKVSHPIDALTWFDSAGQVHLVDAAKGLSDREPIECLRFDDESTRRRLQSWSSRGTHDMDLCATMMMAESLGKSVAGATLWLGYADQFAPMTGLSKKTRLAVTRCVAEIARRLRDG